MSARGTTNRNDRGSAKSRRERKVWMLGEFGDGETCPCHYCGLALTLATLTVDRILPGILGGRYVRANIRPACMGCNSRRGTMLREALKIDRKSVV